MGWRRWAPVKTNSAYGMYAPRPEIASLIVLSFGYDLRFEAYHMPGFVAMLGPVARVDLRPQRYVLAVYRKLPMRYKWHMTYWPSRLAAKVAFLRWRRHVETKIRGVAK